MRTRARLLLAALAAMLAGTSEPALAASTRYKAVRYDQLLGWQYDNHAEALEAFRKSCMDIRAVEWAPLCALAETSPPARTFFETFFVPVIVSPDARTLFTGYFEPVLNGSLYKVDQYRYPIYSLPENLEPKDPNLTRAAIDDGALTYKGLEIAYVDDPVEAYYLHIQGSGRIKLTNGNTIRVGYAGENGHVYRSAAGELVRQGEIDYAEASIEGLKEWVKAHPEKGRTALQFNESYVFFTRLESLDDESGPMGALARPITALRSVAVDPKFVQLGAPVWIEKGGQNAFRRLMVAQDVGSAIKGPQRADIFFGTGTLAGAAAGNTKNGGRMVVLMPIAIANRLDPGG